MLISCASHGRSCYRAYCTVQGSVPRCAHPQCRTMMKTVMTVMTRGAGGVGPHPQSLKRMATLTCVCCVVSAAACCAAMAVLLLTTCAALERQPSPSLRGSGSAPSAAWGGEVGRLSQIGQCLLLMHMTRCVCVHINFVYRGGEVGCP